MVRPHGLSENVSLPVLTWIYGGGFDGGGTSDPRYNMSGLVRLSQETGKPIIGGKVLTVPKAPGKLMGPKPNAI